tara:strand:- start:1940 stop:2650 length:711 start_codon:yes stop_codon:yes gene_type:complete
MFNVIPAIDLLNDSVVRLKQGHYEDVTSYKYSPLDLAKRFEDQGAKRLHIVDLNGARDGRLVHSGIIKKICKHTNLKIEVGGGIRSVDSVHYYLDAGASYVIIGSLFVSNFDLAASIATMFQKKIIAGVDAKSNFVATDGWRHKSSMLLTDLITDLNTTEIHSIIYTDIAKDGMMLGPNIESLHTVSSNSKKPIIASGGIRHKKDVQNIKEIKKVKGCIIGKAILSNIENISSFFV